MVAALQLAFILQLDLARDRGKRRIEIDDARHSQRLTRLQRAALRVREHVLHHRNRQALRDTGALIHLLVLAREKRKLLHHFGDVDGNLRFDRRAPLEPRFLFGDGDAVLQIRRIVRADLAADAILERRHDLAARRVVFRIRREHEHDIERQAHRVALNLHVAFLHDVEQADLNLAGQVGQFVDGEDAAIGARQQAVVNRQFA